MKGLSLIRPVDPTQLDKETLRIYEICDGCRRCFNLCPSFTTLLNGIDRHEGVVAKLTSEDHRRIVDECYYCKLCFNHCPYTPPHQYEIDFPHLMILWKQRLAAERCVRWRDRWLTGTDFIGKIGTSRPGLQLAHEAFDRQAAGRRWPAFIASVTFFSSPERRFSAGFQVRGRRARRLRAKLPCFQAAS